LLASTFLVDDFTSGEHAPKTPKLSDEAKEKRLNQLASTVTSTDLPLYEHEDEPVSFSFQNDELDTLEEYELGFNDSEYYDDQELTDEAVLQQLTFPFSKYEPNLDEQELMRLDALADALEIKRLTGMHVLTDASAMPADAKILSTRIVRTWREKLNGEGQPVWLGRSRFVAREFAWMDGVIHFFLQQAAP
jgi:hypothetical protein